MTVRTNTGDNLKREWNIPAKQVRYHKDGTFYENLTKFPGALTDPLGYILFDEERDYLISPFVHIGQKTNVPKGIKKIQGYVWKKNPQN